MAGSSELRLPSDSKKIQLQKKADWNQERSSTDADFYTIGHASRTLPDIVEILVQAEVASVIDVRRDTVSRHKPDFAKRNLEPALQAVGIDYHHKPELGVPREIRGLTVGQADRTAMWEWYDANVVGEFRSHLDVFFDKITQPVALLCLEIDPTACHRHRLALALEQSGLRGYDL